MALELAHSGYNVGGGVPEGGWTLDSFAPAAGMTVARRGAWFDAATTTNVFISWGPPSAGYAMRGTASLSAIGNLIGRQSPGYFGLEVRTGGALMLRSDNTSRGESAAGVVPLDGTPFTFELVVTPTGLTGLIDGVAVVQSTTAETLATGTAGHYIGHRNGASAGGVTGAIWDVTLEDYSNDANTVYLALDVQNATPGYNNTHPGSTAVDATVGGTVLPVRISATTPGSGVPIPEGPVVVSAELTTAQVFAGAAGTINVTAAEDPYGWLSGVSVAPPIAGVVKLNLTGRVRATALSGSDEVVLGLTREGIGGIAPQGITLDTANEWKSFSIAFVTTDALTGSGFTGRVLTIAGTTTVEVDDVTLTLTLYPDLS